MNSTIFIRDIFKKYPLLFTGSTILLIVASLIEAASVFSLVVIIDLFVNPGSINASFLTNKIINVIGALGLPTSLGWLLGIFMLLNIIKIIFQISAQYLVVRTKYIVIGDIMVGTFEDFFNARWFFFSSNKQGTLLNTFMREIIVIGDAFSAMSRYFSGCLHLILYLIVPFCLSWQVTSVTIAMALFFALPFLFLGKINYRLGRLNTSTANQIGSVVNESFNLAKLILGFGQQPKAVSALYHSFDAHRNVTTKAQVLGFATPLIYQPFVLLVLIIGMIVSKKIALPLSEAVVLFYALVKIIPSIGELTAQKNSIENFFPSYEQVMNLRRQAKEFRQQTGSKIFTGFNREIRLEDLSFAYPGHDLVLDNISVTILKGKMVAFVGESGAGKSTLIDTLMGFNETMVGRITFDGTPLSEFDINSYRHRIGYVPQDSILFNLSIRDNLLWANEKATEDEIRAACRQANAEEFIGRFPDGYNTFVGDRGVRLSGGQVQRIALARAILRKPELLILDEATSALDTHSERLIQQAIENIAKETTVIVVAHRLSTIKNASYICVLKNGRVAEKGTYLELVRENGLFSKMVKLQGLGVAK